MPPTIHRVGRTFRRLLVESLNESNPQEPSIDPENDENMFDSSQMYK